MKLVESSIRYPVTVLVGVILAVLFGLIALYGIPMQMAPTVDRPVVNVTTRWAGASPREVEEQITDKLEEELNSVEGLKEIRSSSSDGRSRITLEFDWGVDKAAARVDVSEKVGLVGDLPDEADKPVIQATSSDEEDRISWIVVESPMPVNQARIVADDVMRPRLERVEGVGSVDMFGGEEREVHVVVDPDALAARGIPLTRLRDALRRENRNIKAGGLEEGKARYVVRTVGQYTDLGRVEKTVVGWEDGHPVYVRDVAKVVFSHAVRVASVRQMGRPAIVFGVARKTGANSVAVMKRIRKVVAELNRQYEGKGLALTIVYDETEYIRDSVDLVTSNLYYGAALAVIVLLLFLRSGTATFVVAFSIPISVIVTFIFLAAFGRTLNIISLAGLAFAVGMVVDNAIVVMENVFRHRQMGKGRFRAAYDGTVEVWGAILSSTLTTLAVFLPILFVKQEAGQLFKDIAIALSCSIGISLLVSITVIPMLSSRLLSVSEHRPAEFLARLGLVAVAAITGAVGWLTAGLGRRILASAVIVGAAVAVAWLLVPNMDYLPHGNRPLILTILKTPPGFNIDHMETVVSTVEHRYLTGRRGAGPGRPLSREEVRPEIDSMFAVALPKDPIIGTIISREDRDKREMRKLVGEFKDLARGIPGVTMPVVFQTPLFGWKFGGGDLEVTVKGPDLPVIEGLAFRIMGGLSAFQARRRREGRSSGLQSFYPSFETGKPELQVRPDREKAAAVGLTVSDAGYVVATMMDGTLAGEFRERGRELDLKVRGPADRRARTQDILRVPLVTPRGDLIHLGDVARLDRTTGPATIEHTDLDRSVRIVIQADPTAPLDQVRKDLEENVVGPVRATLPGLDYTVDIVGQARDLDLTWLAVRGSFLLAVIIVYLLMSSLFESFVSPLVIVLSVPMALTGGIIGLGLARAADPTVKMDVIAMLGFVILAGVVVNNAILIVHQCLNNIRAGLPTREALLESVRTRIRPIFMSSTTSIMGMLPLVLSGGAGTELYRGLGAVVVGGLALSTLFTLFLVPCLFSLALGLRAFLTERFGWKSLEEALREAHAFRAGGE